MGWSDDYESPKDSYEPRGRSSSSSKSDDYESSMNSISISLFDAAGVQKDAFTTRVKQITKDIYNNISELINDDNDLSIYVDTYKKVLYEDGDLTSYGIYPNDLNTVKSKALIFEFSYDQRKCTSIEEINNIRKCYNNVFSFIKEELGKNDIESDFLVYQCLPELFKKEEKNITK